jgi:hypothetical protein
MAGSSMIAFVVIGLLFVTIAVGVGYATSGWGDLCRRFPDRPSAPQRTFLFRTATVGDGWKPGFSFGGLTTFQVCRDGLRVGLTPPFSYLIDSFLVPWEEVVFEPVPLMFPRANIVFGKPMAGVATVSAALARRIAVSSQTLITPAP